MVSERKQKRVAYRQQVVRRLPLALLCAAALSFTLFLFTPMDIYAGNRTEFLFSLPNTYLYSGFLVHTVDCFFRCTVADSSLAHAMDDAAELLWIPVKELRPEDFGLASVRKGIEKLLAQWP